MIATCRRSLLVIGFLAICDGADARKPDKEKAPDYLKVVKKHFKAWDADKNGELSREEIDRHIVDPAVRGELAAALVVLRQHLPSEKTPLPPLSLDNITKAAQTPRSEKSKISEVEKQFEDALSRIAKADRRLFAPGGPKLENIHQGAIGDCYALAALGAFVHRNPEDFVKLIQPQKDGKLHAAFPGGRALDILPLTDAEFCLSGGSSEHTGCWVKVFEKAVGTYLNEKKYAGEVRLALRTVGGGGSTDTVVTLLTGHSCESLHIERARSEKATDEQKRKALDELRSKIKSAVAAKRLICGGTSGALRKDDKIPGIVHGHAYAVLGYDPKSDAILAWNPWGNQHTPKGPAGLQNGYLMKDGMFQVPLSEAVHFLSLSMETDRPKPVKE